MTQEAGTAMGSRVSVLLETLGHNRDGIVPREGGRVDAYPPLSSQFWLALARLLVP